MPLFVQLYIGKHRYSQKKSAQSFGRPGKLEKLKITVKCSIRVNGKLYSFMSQKHKNNESNKEFGKDHKVLPKLGSFVSRTRFNFEKSKS